MEELKKISYYNSLFDYYQSLLTDRQRSYFIMYYENDLSLKEIADHFEISRNAVYDLLNSTIKKLDEYEEKLKLYSKSQKRVEYYDKYLETKDEKWLKKIMEDDGYGIWKSIKPYANGPKKSYW